MNKIIIIIGFILEYILQLLFPYMRNNLSLFTPLIMPITIYLIYPYYKNKKKYIVVSGTVGFIYDLLFTNYLFFNVVLFIIIAIITILLFKNIKINVISNILNLIVIIFLYVLIEGLLFTILSYRNINIREILYYFLHSIITNITYGTIIYFLVKSTKNYRIL